MNANKTDILVLVPHPDDAELGCGGTILSCLTKGKKVAIVDFTKGELSTRGNLKTRAVETKTATNILGVQFRENLNFSDGFFKKDETHCLEVIRIIRKYQPEIIITSSHDDRHPDHVRASEMVKECFFLSGLFKIKTESEGKQQDLWKAKALYFFIQSHFIKPDFILDISPFMEKKLQSIKSYKSQFYNPDSTEPDTFISSKSYLDSVLAKARIFGQIIGVEYGEGFNTTRIVGL